MTQRDRYGLVGVIVIVGGLSALGATYLLIIPGFVLLGIAAWKKNLR